MKRKPEEIDKLVLEGLEMFQTLTPISFHYSIGADSMRRSVRRLIQSGLIELISEHAGRRAARYRRT